MKKTKVYNIFKIIKNIICWALIVALTFAVVYFLSTKISGGIPSMFGYSVLRVSSGSMEPLLDVGDVILSREVSDAEELQIGDVVTYYGSGALDGYFITHEVIKAPYENDEGVIMLQTKGVANEIADREIPFSKVHSQMICKLPFLSAVFDVFFSPWGLLIFIGLIILIFLDEIINIIKYLAYGERATDEGADINEIIERIESQPEEKSDNLSDRRAE